MRKKVHSFVRRSPAYKKGKLSDAADGKTGNQWSAQTSTAAKNNQPEHVWAVEQY
jgi:hypothetical protein